MELRHRESGAVLMRVPQTPPEPLDFHAADLRYADLRGAQLAGARFSHALLAGADLREADLTGADLSRAYLRGADLSGASLRRALLAGTSLDSASCSGANLTRADLTGAFLAETDLTGARLAFADLHLCYLGGSDLARAQLGFTLLVRCRGLHEARGLAEVEHLAPSSLDPATLRDSLPGLPDGFLRGVGLTGGEIRRLRATFRQGPAPAVRIAYADADADFAERLRSDLLAHDIGCWRDRRDLEAGYFAQVLADRDAVRDGLVLVCSRSALDEDRLAEAAARAIAREREVGRQSLFVARLDGEVLGPAARDLARERVEGRRWREDWVRHVQAHPGFDFGAAGAEAYSRELRRLLRAVRRPARRSLPPARLPVFPH